MSNCKSPRRPTQNVTSSRATAAADRAGRLVLVTSSDAVRSTSRRAWLWSSAVVAICAILFGSVYWTAPYSDLDIGEITLPVYLLAMAPVVVLRASRTAPFPLALATLPTGLVLAVMIRVAVDVSSDPTSHNLWPFELVIAGVVGLFWGLVAAVIGELIARLFRRRPAA